MKNNGVVKTSKKYSMISDMFAVFKILTYGAAVFVGIATKNLIAPLGMVLTGFSVGTVGEVKFSNKAKEAKRKEDFIEYCGKTHQDDKNTESDTENNV